MTSHHRLNYVAQTTSPDITVAVNLFSRYSSEPKKDLYRDLVKVLAYLIQTKNIYLQYDRLNESTYNVYSDSSFKIQNAVTTIGTAHMVNGTVFDFFKSKKVFSSYKRDRIRKCVLCS